MNRIKQRHSHSQPKPSLVAEGGEKVETATTTSACVVVGLNSGSLAPTCATVVKNLQQEMTVEMKSQKLHVSPGGDNVLPELTIEATTTTKAHCYTDMQHQLVQLCM